MNVKCFSALYYIVIAFFCLQITFLFTYNSDYRLTDSVNVDYRVQHFMALGDTDDFACSQHGRQNPVVLYCHTCQLLLCPRCVSHGPAGEEPSHRDHTYLEIRDAHDMLKVGEL